MKIKPEDFRVQAGDKVKLDKWPTKVKPAYKSKKAYHKLLDEQVDELSDLQRLLYASNRYAVLLIFQAMDAAGKDGAIRHVMSGVNPQGCQVFSFKHPSAKELDHDFLWRTTQAPAGARPHRHLQPVLLRGGADRAGASRDSAAARACRMSVLDEKTIWQRALPLHRRPGEASLIAMARASSSSSCTSRRKNSASAFSTASTSPTRTGNSVLPTSRASTFGHSTCRPMKRA